MRCVSGIPFLTDDLVKSGGGLTPWSIFSRATPIEENAASDAPKLNVVPVVSASPPGPAFAPIMKMKNIGRGEFVLTEKGSSLQPARNDGNKERNILSPVFPLLSRFAEQ